MSKGLKALGLKALKELKKRYGKNFSLNDDERCHIIEITLKDYERVMVEKNDLFKRWTKEHQALEIVVRKKVNMQLLIESIDLDFYNSHWFMKLCQEEYELLKEILL